MAKGGGQAVSASSVDLVERSILFTDIERSTELWESDGDAMRALLRHHDTTVAEVVSAHGGDLVKRTGDGAVAAFVRSTDGVAAALSFLRRLEQAPTDLGVEAAALRSRVGLHRGWVEARDGDLYGPTMHRAARIMSAGHGGQILVSSTVTDELRATDDLPAGVELVDRGTHRLKGLHEPEPIHQVVAAGLQQEFPPLVTANVSAGWLPALGAGLVGRDALLDDVATRLAPGSTVTLVGPGGVGKTSLAVHVAHAVRAAFPDGAWFVDLSGVSEPHQVLPTVAERLRLSVDGSADVADVVRDALGIRKALVLLDNCEHQLDAVVDALERVRGDVTASTLLCTSQRDLGLAGEDVVQVGPLAHSDRSARSPAVELFVRRVASLRPDFEPSDADLAVIERVCARLDGLPLAIELAASRARTFPLREVADRLDATFELLRSRDGPERHRTLHSAISWSTDLLEPEDREVLHALGVFRGGFDWRGAAAVAGNGDSDEAVDSLDELARRSLVVRADDRYRLLAPVRESCLAALERDGRLTRCEAAHAAHLSSLVPVPFDDPDPHVVRQRVQDLLAVGDDLRAAFAWYLDHDMQAATDLALHAVDHWLAADRPQEGFEILRRIDLAALDVDVRLSVLGWISAFAWMVGRNDLVESTALAAIALAEEEGEPYPRLAGSRLAVWLAFSARPDDAVAVAEQVETAARSGSTRESRLTEAARLLGVLAVPHAVAGDVERAVALADEGLALARAVGASCAVAALSNRLILTPGHPSTVPLIAELRELAAITGRVSAQGHTTLAAAQLRRREGDTPGFLSGVADFCDLMLTTGERTAAANALELVPSAVVDHRPREAAVLAAAIDAVRTQIGQPGTKAFRATSDSISAALAADLGDEELRRLHATGREFSLEEAVDLLRWVADHDDAPTTVVAAGP